MRAYGLKDPCGNYKIKRDALEVFVKSIINGENIRNKNVMRASTVKEYAIEINELHALRNLPEPIDFKNKSDTVVKLISNLQKEEDVAKQRKPLSNQVAAEMLRRGQQADPLSLQALMADITKVARKVGPRAGEFTQTTSKRPDYHKYPSGKTVIKSICADWLTFKSKRGNTIRCPVKNRSRVESVTLKWKIQKNRRNGEEVTYTRNHTKPELCIVDALINLWDRAEKLGQQKDLPICVYEHKGSLKYLTRNEATKYIQKTTLIVHPDMTMQELSYYSCHSYRVWAAVLLHEAGQDGDVIRIRLRWVSEAYRVYLRNTSKTAELHNKALDENTKEILFELDSEELNVTTSEVQQDNEMGELNDDD